MSLAIIDDFCFGMFFAKKSMFTDNFPVNKTIISDDIHKEDNISPDFDVKDDLITMKA